MFLENDWLYGADDVMKKDSNWNRVFKFTYFSEHEGLMSDNHVGFHGIWTVCEVDFIEVEKIG